LFLIFFGTGYEVLKMERIHERSGLGHRAVWYIVMSVFEEHFGCIFTGCQNTDTVCPDSNPSDITGV
jgi:hypothetical protein